MHGGSFQTGGDSTVRKSITILGSTGSVGTCTLEIVDAHPDRFKVHALVAGSNAALLLEQARRFNPDIVGLADEREVDTLRAGLGEDGCEVVCGEEACAELAGRKVDVVVAAIVGNAGLASVMAACEAGQTIALANKESMVSAGRLVSRTARSRGARIIPVDSEHSAIFQCLAGCHAEGKAACPPFEEMHESVSRLCITASGGPFRQRDLGSFADITPEEAVRHPHWSMGRKISVDSATMMNKGLEVIEAAWLFGMPGSAIEVLVHPQVAVHGMVCFKDGSMVAQMASASMKTPIALALTWPERLDFPTEPIDLAELGRLEFEEVDTARYPCYELARRSMAAHDSAPAVLNAANEVAVAAFLAGRIGFGDIASTVEHCLDSVSQGPVDTLEGVMELDARARQTAKERIARIPGR